MEEPETGIHQPCDFIDLPVDCDRSHLQHRPLDAVKEERESINGTSVGVPAHSPPSCMEGRLPLGCFYTASNHGASPTSPTSPSKQMAIITRHSHLLSSTTSDFTIPAPPVESAPTPPLSPAVLTTRSTPEERFEAQPVGQRSTCKKSSKSVSRLCFPFVTTSMKKKDGRKSLVPGTANLSPPVVPASPLESAPSPPPRHKHSCFPTRFSPFSRKGASPVQKHQKHSRHAYINHGYSHEALEHVKWFWNVRREGSVVEVKPQFARTVHPQSRGTVSEPSPGGLRTPTPTLPSTVTTTDSETIPASIHPRRGDISALRDPQCAEVDRTFGAMGVWTIAKMVWMVEVDVGVERMERELEKERRRRRSRLRMKILWDVHESDDGDEGALDASHRTTSMSSLSDDSEMTLVEDESSVSCLEKDEGGRIGTCASDTDEDEEGLQMLIRGRKSLPRANAQGSGRSSPSARSGSSSMWTSPSVSPGRELDLHLDKSNISRSLPRALYQTGSMPTRLTGAGCFQSEWATDWMTRWEIVKNLSREVGCL